MPCLKLVVPKLPKFSVLFIFYFFFKKSVLNLGPKKTYLRIFLEWMLKKLFSFLKWATSNFSECWSSCRARQKHQIWDQKCLSCGFLTWNLKKLWWYFTPAPSNFLKCRVSSKIWDQICLIWEFLNKPWEKYCHIWNQKPWIC